MHSLSDCFVLLYMGVPPVLRRRHAAPFLKKGRKVMVIGKIKMIGDFLDGHGRLAQQIHGNLKPQGQVIVVRCGPVFPLKHVVGPGAGEMSVGGNLLDMQGTVDILLDEAFHGEGRGGLLDRKSVV